MSSIFSNRSVIGHGLKTKFIVDRSVWEADKHHYSTAGAHVEASPGTVVLDGPSMEIHAKSLRRSGWIVRECESPELAPIVALSINADAILFTSPVPHETGFPHAVVLDPASNAGEMLSSAISESSKNVTVTVGTWADFRAFVAAQEAQVSVFAQVAKWYTSGKAEVSRAASG